MTEWIKMVFRSRRDRQRAAVAGLVLVLFVAAVVVFASRPASASYVPFGNVLMNASQWLQGAGVVSKGGVTVYSNGYYDVSGDISYPAVGMKWQCIELAQRLYQAKGWASGPWGVNADGIYNLSKFGFISHPNGTYTPVPGDMIVHQGTAENEYDGHVAIVDSVSGSTIYAVEQNDPYDNNGRTTYQLESNGKWGQPGAAPVLGFVHSPANHNTNGPSVASGSNSVAAGGTPAAPQVILPTGVDQSQTGAVHGDFNGSGYDGVAMLYDYGGNNTAMLEMDGSAQGLKSPGQVWSAGGAYSWNRMKMVAGNFYGDGYSDVAVLYDYGGENTAMLMFRGSKTGLHFVGQAWSAGGPGKWDWDTTDLVAGDFTGDGYDDVALLYDYGNNNTAMLVMDGSTNGLQPPGQVWSAGGAYNWDRIKLAAGDFNGDGYDDVALLYDYGGENTAVLVMDGGPHNLQAPGQVWSAGGPGKWNWETTELVAGNFNGGKYSDLGLLYDYGNNNTAMLVMDGGSQSLQPPGQVWSAGGKFTWDNMKLASGDFTGNGYDDVAILYDYGGDNTAMLVMDGGSHNLQAPGQVWSAGGLGKWNWDRTQIQ